MLSSEAVKHRAREMGFDVCGVALPESYPELKRLRTWLDEGRAGEMHYLERTAERRSDVRAVMPSTRSVIAVGMLYHIDRPYSTEIADRGEAQIARYARGDDYHDVMTAKLASLAAWLQDESDEPIESRVYVDSGPVQERVYAQHAGLGWIGKNTCLINPDLGSWLLLGEILTSAALAPDAPGFDRCGTCTLCLDACPTSAIVEPGTVDATRCLSYFTIELKGPIPLEWRDAVGAHVFGCDVCQEVCPWNQAVPLSSHAEYRPRSDFDRPSIVALWERSDAALQQAMRGSPTSRPRVRGMRRNLAVALGNLGTPESAAALAASGVRAETDAPSMADPIVAEHIAWGLTTGAGEDGRIPDS